MCGVWVLIGLVMFYVVCLVGVLVNVGVVNLIYVDLVYWWVVGVVGVIMGVVWNYVVSLVLIWWKF